MAMSTKGDVLAIDQSTHCGVTRGGGSALPVVKSWKLPTNEDALGEMLFDLRVRLIQEVKAGPLSCIIFEKPLLNQKTPNLIMMRKLYSIAGLIEAVGYEFDIKVLEIDAGTWKRAFCGRGNVSKNERPYPPMVRCEELGIRVNNMDEADSVGIWATYCASRGHHWLAGGMFGSLL